MDGSIRCGRGGKGIALGGGLGGGAGGGLALEGARGGGRGARARAVGEGRRAQEAGDLYEVAAPAADRAVARATIAGGTVVVGAPDHNGESGAVYVYRGATYDQVAKLTASDGAPEDRFGTSVAIDGATVVVGAPGGWACPGSAYLIPPTAGRARPFQLSPRRVVNRANPAARPL